jgi:hypothetical protein
MRGYLQNKTTNAILGMIINKLLHLKHWQLFLLLIGAPLILEFLFIGNKVAGLAENFKGQLRLLKGKIVDYQDKWKALQA